MGQFSVSVHDVKQATLLNGLLRGDQHRGGTRCLRVFRLEAPTLAPLRAEVERLRRRHRPSSVADLGHVTHWTASHGEVLQYSLLNASGRTDDFSTDHDLSCLGKWFFDTASYPMLGGLIADWPHLVNFRVNMLGPAAGLPPHEEYVPFRTRSGTVGARLRFHLPVETNPDAWLNLDGQVFHFDSGTIYLVNQGCIHAARNDGRAARVHLVWDCLLTEDLFRFLFEPGAAPSYFVRVARRQPAPVREEALRGHRCLPRRLSTAEAAEVAVCDPQ
jgi:hypothetical protein